ncbi:uncharacterized protein EV154DRAFT_552433 [Mucor mucedo]|uniref:uncharacterized protein n=1 Tax=Mucor mucedo TaxID=29922 RepID=UPI00221EFDE6|nr:uncharacterized protein EV154DRAFT_552433 [Mucor mucedo]KAI7890252.1 hypothetical protein EV154DRAFT_552433 [Mucor mucedo]
MDHIYQLLCIPRAPSLSIKDFNNGNYNQFLEKSMKSASSLSKDAELKADASNQLAKLLSAKSHSPSNTLRTMNEMFAEAAKACHFDRERALIEWLQTCVSTVVEFGLDPASADNKIYTEKPPIEQKKSSDRGVAQSKNKKKPVQEPEESEWDDDEFGYDRIGHSDDDYCPSDEDDAVVPKKQPGRKSSPAKKASSSSDTEVKKPKAPRKKKDDQVVPVSKKDATFPVIKEGAGSKALHKYIQDIPCANALSSDALSNGYFARAFFFPSKDSFNAFLSVLNSAQKSIDICVFAFTDDDVADALIAAKKRNVAIQIITDNQQAAGKGADAKRLQESYGIPFKTDNTTGYMHNKFAIIDNKTLINGSFNWSKGARFKNRENVLITNIPQCIKEYQGQFDSLWKEF